MPNSSEAVGVPLDPHPARTGTKSTRPTTVMVTGATLLRLTVGKLHTPHIVALATSWPNGEG